MLEVIIPCALGATVVLATARYVLKRRRLAVAATTGGVRTAVLEVKDGQEVKVVGRVKLAGEPTEAPLTKRRCACWEVLYEHRGVKAFSESYSDEFLVTTQTGTITVRPSRPLISLVKERGFDLNSDDRVDWRLNDFCESRLIEWDGLNIKEALPGVSRYIFEGALVEGAKVAVKGVARWEPDPTSTSGGVGYRDVPRRLVLLPPPEGQIEITNESEAFSEV